MSEGTGERHKQVKRLHIRSPPLSLSSSPIHSTLVDEAALHTWALHFEYSPSLFSFPPLTAAHHCHTCGHARVSTLIQERERGVPLKKKKKNTRAYLTPTKADSIGIFVWIGIKIYSGIQSVKKEQVQKRYHGRGGAVVASSASSAAVVTVPFYC